MVMLKTQAGPTLQVEVVELEELSKLAKALEEDQEFLNAFMANPQAAIQERGYQIPQELIPDTIEQLDLSEVPSPDIAKIREVEIGQTYRPE